VAVTPVTDGVDSQIGAGCAEMCTDGADFDVVAAVVGAGVGRLAADKLAVPGLNLEVGC
jgi:hypothetical protein